METLQLFKDTKSIYKFYGITEMESDDNARIKSGYFIDPIKAITILFPGTLTLGIIMEHEEDSYKWEVKSEGDETPENTDPASE